MNTGCYRDLAVWQRGLDFVDDCYTATEGFPRTQTYSLANQLQRSAVSVPSNIAEGAGRGHTREFIQHLYIARGSLFEAITQVHIAGRRKYITAVDLERLLTEAEEIGRMLYGLIASLERRLTTP